MLFRRVSRALPLRPLLGPTPHARALLVLLSSSPPCGHSIQGAFSHISSISTLNLNTLSCSASPTLSSSYLIPLLAFSLSAIRSSPIARFSAHSFLFCGPTDFASLVCCSDRSQELYLSGHFSVLHLMRVHSSSCYRLPLQMGTVVRVRSRTSPPYPLSS